MSIGALPTFLLFLMSISLFASQIKIPSEMTFEKNCVPGEVVEGYIPLFNAGSELASVKISLADYLYNAKGETFYLNPGSHGRSNATWACLSSEIVKIPPHNQINFHYRVHIPKDSTLNGTYWSIILVEPYENVSFKPCQETHLDIKTVVRYGFQVITNIQNSGTYDLKVIDKELIRDHEKLLLSIDVENTGTWVMAPKMHVEIYNSKGEKLKKLEFCKNRIYPTCSLRYVADISGLPPGTYPAIVLFDQGDKALFGMQYTFEI